MGRIEPVEEKIGDIGRKPVIERRDGTDTIRQGGHIGKDFVFFG